MPENSDDRRPEAPQGTGRSRRSGKRTAPPGRRRGRREGGPAAGGRDSLRPERIQARLAPAQLRRRLRALPGWRLTADGGAIERTFHFPAYPLLVVFLNLVTGLAELAGPQPEMEIRGCRLTLRLGSPAAGGPTAGDLDFAGSLEGAGELGGGR